MKRPKSAIPPKAKYLSFQLVPDQPEVTTGAILGIVQEMHRGVMRSAMQGPTNDQIVAGMDGVVLIAKSMVDVCEAARALARTGIPVTKYYKTPPGDDGRTLESIQGEVIGQIRNISAELRNTAPHFACEQTAAAATLSVTKSCLYLFRAHLAAARRSANSIM